MHYYDESKKWRLGLWVLGTRPGLSGSADLPDGHESKTIPLASPDRAASVSAAAPIRGLSR
jgi:hypothetical protein